MRQLTSLFLLPFTFACLPEEVESETPVIEAESGSYYMSFSIETPDNTLWVLGLSETLDESLVDLENVFEFDGIVREFGGDFYVNAGARITKWTVDDGALTEGPTLDLSGEGIEGGYFLVADADNGFLLDNQNLVVTQFNPTTMLITESYDLSSIPRDDIGQEIRRPIYRDGTLFIYIAYTDNRQVFINNLTVGVLDLESGDVTVLEDERCPVSAGFGGYLDENNDLYLWGDAFGGFAVFAGETKPNCLLRIPSGSTTFDDFQFTPQTLLPQFFPFGMHYAGNGVATGSGLDLAAILGAKDPFAAFAANSHATIAYDITTGEALLVDDIPLGGLQTESNYQVEGLTYLAPTTGEIDVDDFTNVESSMIELDPETLEASELFRFPGFLGGFGRIE
ncbi:MAG: hypothetical protein AAGA48_25335 [Myxococcota bacterium]